MHCVNVVNMPYCKEQVNYGAVHIPHLVDHISALGLSYTSPPQAF